MKKRLYSLPTCEAIALTPQNSLLEGSPYSGNSIGDVENGGDLTFE
ncbi:MAG: hypothetical protein IKH24_05015 [Bacteroidales bacterium]|nr:hypothetical protein [Bacteroidales bacterium]